MTKENSPHIVILAAGKGKRMFSKHPKVLHPVLFRPMLHYVLDLAFSIPHRSVSLIVGHGREQVEAACGDFKGLRFFHQAEQLGTGHAVKMAESVFSGDSGPVVILNGDVPLLKKTTLENLLALQESSKSHAAILTARLADPTGYGRIIRNSAGRVLTIREQADCSDNEKKVGEINAGVYCFGGKELAEALGRLKPSNRQNEFYLTDVVELFTTHAKDVQAMLLSDSSEILGINDREALANVQKKVQRELNRRLMLSGVTLVDPESCWIDSRSKIESDVFIEGQCVILNSSIGRGSVIENGTRIVDSKLAQDVLIRQNSYIQKSEIHSEVQVGPMAHLRPGSRLESKVKVGNFVEIKKSTLKAGAKASHLSYIGDAEIGRDVNLGCGFITCNYDGGPKKHATIIEDGVFVGSDTQMVAPVRVGANSYVASGSTVTEDVPADSLVISRGKQITKKDYAKKYRKGT